MVPVKVEPAYRRFRVALRRSTVIDPDDLAAWIAGQGNKLAMAYTLTGEEGSILDFEVFIRQQYVSARRDIF